MILRNLRRPPSSYGVVVDSEVIIVLYYIRQRCILSTESSSNPGARKIMLHRIGFPNALRPLMHALCVFFSTGCQVHIGNRHLPAIAQRFWFLDRHAAIQPFLDSRVNLRIASMFHPTTEAGEMGSVGLARPAVRLQVLHAIGIECQVVSGCVAGMAVSTRADFVTQRLASGASTNDRCAALWASI